MPFSVQCVPREDGGACLGARWSCFYPFLLLREPANTQVVHVRRGLTADPEDFDFILVFTRRGEEPTLAGHRLVAATAGPTMTLYQRTTGQCRPAFYAPG